MTVTAPAEPLRPLEQTPPFARLPVLLIAGAVGLVPLVFSGRYGVVVTALIARELGGERRAQLMAAGAYAVSSYLIGTGHLLATSTLTRSAGR